VEADAAATSLPADGYRSLIISGAWRRIVEVCHFDLFGGVKSQWRRMVNKRLGEQGKLWRCRECTRIDRSKEVQKHLNCTQHERETVPFEAQRQTKSIVYSGKNTLPNWAWRGRIVANPWLLREVVGSEHDNTRNAFSHDWLLFFGQGCVWQLGISACWNRDGLG
jgi:hypothetical protein